MYSLRGFYTWLSYSIQILDQDFSPNDTPDSPFSECLPLLVHVCKLLDYFTTVLSSSLLLPLLDRDILLSLPSEDGESRSWLGAEGSPQRENPQQRLRWQAHLEFTHNHTVGDLTWDLIASVLPRSERLHSLVLGGIPHSMRPQVRGLACTIFD